MPWLELDVFPQRGDELRHDHLNKVRLLPFRDAALETIFQAVESFLVNSFKLTSRLNLDLIDSTNNTVPLPNSVNATKGLNILK